MSIAAVVAEEANEFSSVIIPAPGTNLLLPNICVAEILPWCRTKALEGTPAWCLGLFSWRGQRLPVVNFMAFNEPQSQPPQSARCLIVMNRSRTREGPIFYALASTGMLRMLQLLDGDVTDADHSLGIADVMKVEVAMETATIPNLEFVEQQVAALDLQPTQ